MKKFKRTVAAGLSAALVLTCVGIEPTRAEPAGKAPQAAPAQAYTGPTDVSSRRRTYHRGVSPGQAAAKSAHASSGKRGSQASQFGAGSREFRFRRKRQNIISQRLPRGLNASSFGWP